MSTYKLYSYTVIRTSGADFSEKTPYLCGLIEDEAGDRKVVYLGAYTEGMRVHIDDRVEFKQTLETGLEEYSLV